MNQKFDPTKPVQTRDGKPARIICTNRQHSLSIVALINDNGTETVHTFTPLGECWGSRGIAGYADDLINTPMKITRTVYLAVYDDGQINMFRTKENVDKCTFNANLFAIKEITFEATEGEGL